MNATHNVRAYRLIRLAAVAALVTVLPACSGHAAAASGPQSSGAGSAEPSSASAPSWNLVVLGDSLSRPNGCYGCSGYADLYAAAIARRAGVTINTANDAAIELSNVPPVDAGALLAQILTDGSVRRDIANADVVVISIGFNDTPWNRLDDPCNAAARYPVVQWSKLDAGCIDRVVADYKHTLDQILTQIDRLRGCGEMPGVPPCSQRGQSDTLVRIVTVYNSTIGDNVDPSWNSPLAIAPTVRANNMMVHAQCEVIRIHGGRCADIYRVMNGPDGSRPAAAYLDSQGYTELNQLGHKAAAAALIKLGLAPLR